MNTQFQNTDSAKPIFDLELEALVSALEAKWVAEREAREAASVQ